MKTWPFEVVYDPCGYFIGSGLSHADIEAKCITLLKVLDDHQETSIANQVLMNYQRFCRRRIFWQDGGLCKKGHAIARTIWDMPRPPMAMIRFPQHRVTLYIMSHRLLYLRPYGYEDCKYAQL